MGLFETLDEVMGLGDDEEHEIVLDSQTCAELLREAWGQYCTQHDLVPGMIVRMKPLLGNVRDASDPHIYMRRIDLTKHVMPIEAQHCGSSHVAEIKDAVVGWLNPRNKVMELFLMVYDRLEPHPDFTDYNNSLKR